jgi:hypothetical protein
MSSCMLGAGSMGASQGAGRAQPPAAAGRPWTPRAASFTPVLPMAAVAQLSPVHWDSRLPNSTTLAAGSRLRRRSRARAAPHMLLAHSLRDQNRQSPHQVAGSQQRHGSNRPRQRVRMERSRLPSASSGRYPSPTPGTQGGPAGRRDGATAGSFAERLSSTSDARQQRLMLLQKKMQLEEAMEKKLRMEQASSSPSPFSAARPHTPEIAELVSRQVEGLLLSTEDSATLTRPSPMGGGSGEGAFFSLVDSPALLGSQHGRVSVSSLQASELLAAQTAQLRDSWRASSAMGTTEPLIAQTPLPLQPLRPRSTSTSLPQLRGSPMEAAAGAGEEASGGGGGAAERRARARRQTMALGAETRRRYRQQEEMVKRLVRTQMRDLRRAFTQWVSAIIAAHGLRPAPPKSRWVEQSRAGEGEGEGEVICAGRRLRRTRTAAARWTRRRCARSCTASTSCWRRGTSACCWIASMPTATARCRTWSSCATSARGARAIGR